MLVKTAEELRQFSARILLAAGADEFVLQGQLVTDVLLAFRRVAQVY